MQYYNKSEIAKKLEVSRGVVQKLVEKLNLKGIRFIGNKGENYSEDQIQKMRDHLDRKIVVEEK